MSHDLRPDPDVLLAQARLEENQEKKGRLFILLGMCPGVGKTYAMLLLARQRQLEGLDVIAGVIETHGRAETAALLDGLNVLPRRSVTHQGRAMDEFDLDAALAARPDLLLVDELAHSNATGSRHLKRYQDVLELLDAGIDVCTTVNVQHIESQVDVVRQVTGVAVQETVPDSILDRAHEIQLIDLSVEKLMARLAGGKVYLGERAQAAADGFFNRGNLTALRELSLRFTAERVDRDLDHIRTARRIASPWKTNARLLVGVGPTPYSESLIRWTRRASGRHNCPWIAVWVERLQPLSAAEQELLGNSLSLVRRLGGEVVHAMGEDISETLLKVARERNVSQIIVGKPDRKSRWRATLADRIIAGSGDIEVCVVRPLLGKISSKATLVPASKASTTIAETAGAIAVTALITALCWRFLPMTGYTLPALAYLFAILLAAFRFSRWPILIMAAVCALCWNFFFISPRFTLEVRAPEDMLMLAMFFAVALSMGHLTSRLRKREFAERRRQIETDALLRVTQSAALAPTMSKGLGEALRIIDSVIDSTSALIIRKGDHSLPENAYEESSYLPLEREIGVAGWAFSNKQVAGRFTDTLPLSEATWFPLQTATSVMGVLGIRRSEEAGALNFGERQTIEAFALQLALVLEKEHFIQAVAEAELLEKSDRLRRNLLDSVSHELKTPLAVIRGALEGMNGVPSESYLKEIDVATHRLQRLIEGLLQMTRLESQVIEPHLDWCDLHDVIQSAVQSVAEALRTHPVDIRIEDEMPLIKTDQALLSQALVNVIHNAAIYSPPGGGIEIGANYNQGNLVLTVRDHGPGVPVGDESKVFGKFFRAVGAPAGGSGLGLSITRGFVQALGGQVVCRNHPGGGCLFEINLKADALAADLLQCPGTDELNAKPSE